MRYSCKLSYCFVVCFPDSHDMMFHFLVLVLMCQKFPLLPLKLRGSSEESRGVMLGSWKCLNKTYSVSHSLWVTSSSALLCGVRYLDRLFWIGDSCVESSDVFISVTSQGYFNWHFKNSCWAKTLRMSCRCFIFILCF